MATGLPQVWASGRVCDWLGRVYDWLGLSSFVVMSLTYFGPESREPEICLSNP